MQRTYQLMSGSSAIIACAMAILFSLSINIAAQETHPSAVSPSQEIRIKEEVKLIIEKYYRYFSANEMEKLPFETHNIPYSILGTGRAYTSVEQSNENYANSIPNIKKEEPDYERSVFTIQNICVLSPLAAIASGFNTRKRTDGSIITIRGTSYILELTDNGWRISSFASTSLDKVVRC